MSGPTPDAVPGGAGERPVGGWTGGERGTLRALRLGGRLLRLLGPRLTATAIVGPAALYFVLFAGRARRGSRQYLEILWSRPEGARALGTRPRLRHTLRHLWEFGVHLQDRVLLWSGQHEALHIDYAGDEHLRRLRREGRGAILVGAHQGSFDMMRVLAARNGVPVNVLMLTDQAEQLTRYLRELSPEVELRVLAIDPTSVRTAFRIRACIERGEFVGILADRKGLFPDAALHDTRLLGRPVQIPLQPFSLAAVLGCPILRATCLRTGPGRYQVAVAPLRPLDAGAGPGPRPSRREQVKIAAELAEAFTASLERACVQAPYQWFNFFDYFGGLRADPGRQTASSEAAG